MLDDTLVVWTTEFGRLPFTQGATAAIITAEAFATWLAGAGNRGSSSHGQATSLATRAPKVKTYCYDLHATI